jgi:AraC-like DNA-binding protein
LNGRDNPHHPGVEPDGGGQPVSRGHLNPDADAPLARYRPAPDLAALVRHHWIPEWALPEGRAVTARVLGYPALNLVVDRTGVLLAGPTTTATERVLQGRGWAVGVLLQPAATPALGRDASALLDRAAWLDEPLLRDRVVAAMDGGAPPYDRHRGALDVVEAWLRERLGPVTEQGRLANAAVALVEQDPTVTRVADLADRLHVAPRTLQRAVRRCTGMSPHEVVRRRRLQEAADRLRRGAGDDLARVAAEVGFADHAHLTRAFSRAVKESPRHFRDRRGEGHDATMAGRGRQARVADIDEVARALPGVTVTGTPDRPTYQVSGRSFVLFRGPRPDAVDPATGERYPDVVVVWVPDEETKTAMVEDPGTPWFTTRHFDGHDSVLLRTSRVAELSRDELAEAVQDAWLCRAPKRAAKEWLASLDGSDPRFVSPASGQARR